MLSKLTKESDKYVTEKQENFPLNISICFHRMVTY
jgi:hypothetical protein